jgi:PAS domain S-box-containing protein
MVVTVYPEALEFVVNDCRDVFPHVPIIALHLPQNFMMAERGRRIIGHFPTYDIAGTIDIALKLVPRTNRVYVVSGAHKVDKWLEDQARRDLKKWETRLEFVYLSHMPIEDMLATVSKAPPGSVILALAVTQDVAGKSHTGLGIAHQLSQVSTVPVFGMFETALGYGITGGSIISWDLIGKRAGQLVMDILGGVKSLDDVPPVLDVPPVPMFDWRELRRWKLSLSALPKGSIIINRELTIWDFKYYIIGALIFCLAETALIIFLIVQRRRKKVAEESLRQRTEELDQFFNVTLDLFCIANTDGYFLRLNPAWESVLGYTREELTAKRFLEFVHPDDLDRTREAISTLTSQQKIFLFENRYRCKDGTYRWLQWSSAPAGKLIYAAARDITERKRASDALRESEERLRDIMFNMAEWVWEVDKNGIYTYSSQKGLDLFGHVIGKTPFDFMPPDEAKRVAAIFSEIVANKAPIKDLENWNIRKNGESIYLLTNGVPILDEEGNLKGYRGVDKDITVHKWAEKALEQSEEKFRLLTENSVVGIYIIQDAKMVYVNPSFAKTFGYSPEEIIGTLSPKDLIHPEDIQDVMRRFQERLEGKTERSNVVYKAIKKDGSLFYIEVYGMVIDYQGRPAVMGTLIDVTERKQVQEELRRYQEHLEELVRERTAELVTARDEAEIANRAKSTFLANMSHELRTPLNTILGIAQLMERDAGFPGRHRDTLKILSRSGAHLLELINDVLELSKIEAGKMIPVMTSFDLHSFLGDLEEMIRLRTGQKGLKLLFEHKSPLPRYIETDLRKLRQVLLNLLGNAIKYTEKGGVTLRIAFKEGMDTTAAAKDASWASLEFEIEDTGIGIAQEDTERIFEPFVQVNPGRTARDGTGLGLTLSRMFVELLGGEINIRSQVGRGSIFAFDIPARLAEGATIHTEVSDRQVIGLIPGQPPYLLLVVDDSVENRFVLRRLLEQGGFSVLEAANGQEAVDLFKDRQPHLIWMDLRMPGMDGDEAARRIREAESGRLHTPIIALTAGLMEYEGPPAHSQVFDDWVYKPYRETEIFAKLEKHLGVQFVYRPPLGSEAEADKGWEKDALTPADLAVLPVEWLQKFFQTLRRGGSEELLNLIDRIRSEHADLARALTELVHIYRFDKLIAVTGEVLKESSNG